MTGDIFEFKKEVSSFKDKNGYEIEGLWLPRVTSILEVVAKPGLLHYYAQQKNFYAAQESMRNAAINGSMIHDACEAILQGDHPDIDKRIQHSVQNFVKWKEQHKVKVLGVEQKIIDCDENFYIGTMDILAEIGGKIGVLDIKTGSGIWNEYGLQTAAYMAGYNKLAGKNMKAQTRWILRLDQYQICQTCGAKRREKGEEVRVTGGKRICSHNFAETEADFEFKELKDFDHDFKGFLHAKGLWEWQNRPALQKINNYPCNFKV